MKCAAIGWNRRSRFVFERRECPVDCLVFTIHRQYLALANPGQPLIISARIVNAFACGDMDLIACTHHRRKRSPPSSLAGVVWRYSQPVKSF